MAESEASTPTSEAFQTPRADAGSVLVYGGSTSARSLQSEYATPRDMETFRTATARDDEEDDQFYTVRDHDGDDDGGAGPASDHDASLQTPYVASGGIVHGALDLDDRELMAAMAAMTTYTPTAAAAAAGSAAQAPRATLPSAAATASASSTTHSGWEGHDPSWTASAGANEAWVPTSSDPPEALGHESVRDIFSLARHNRFDEVSELFDMGVPPDVRDQYGNTVLIIACQNGLKRIVKLALRRGCDIDAQNLRGNTALHFCYAYGNGATLGAYLVEKGANPTVRNHAGFMPHEGIG